MQIACLSSWTKWTFDTVSSNSPADVKISERARWVCIRTNDRLDDVGWICNLDVDSLARGLTSMWSDRHLFRVKPVSVTEALFRWIMPNIRRNSYNKIKEYPGVNRNDRTYPLVNHASNYFKCKSGEIQRNGLILLRSCGDHAWLPQPGMLYILTVVFCQRTRCYKFAEGNCGQRLRDYEMVSSAAIQINI